MIAEWDTNRLFNSNPLERKEEVLFASLRSVLQGVPSDIMPRTHDIWCRDNMPVQVDDNRFCQFVYAPADLRGFEHLVTPPEKCRLLTSLQPLGRTLRETHLAAEHLTT